MTGCASVPPGAVKTWGSGNRFAEHVSTATGGHSPVLYENRLTPILCINNLEGSAWAGKTDWVPSERLNDIAASVDRVVRERLNSRVADSTSKDSPRFALIVSPNGYLVPDLTMKDLGKLVAGQTAQVAAGVPAPVAIGTATAARADPKGERHGYILSTHPAYGTSVQVMLRWELIDLSTGTVLHKAELGTILRMPRDVKKKQWAELEEADRAMIWDGLAAGIDEVVDDQLTKLGF